jgi:Secretion system C-terminal sorting domain
MKLIKLLTLFFATTCTYICTAQNVSINIQTENTGLVDLGGTVFLLVEVRNTDASGTVVQNKVRPQISVPAAISSISLTAADHILPSGWTITSNSGSVIRITNTTDPIPANTTRTIRLLLRGNVIGGPSQIIANLTFVGAAPAGDIGADNTSSSSIEVILPTPVTLTDFTAALINCEPFVKWTTESEINSDRFEIERSNAGRNDWTKVGTVTAQGNSTRKTEYSLTDKNLNVTAEKVLYRLKMIDKDGRYTYSPVLPVSINCNTAKVTVFPNPVQNGKLYVSITGTKGQTEATLLTLSGQVITKKNVNNGTNKIDVSNTANGVYILNITDSGVNGMSKKVKVLIQN